MRAKLEPMKVGELIKRLKAIDPERVVVLQGTVRVAATGCSFETGLTPPHFERKAEDKVRWVLSP